MATFEWQAAKRAPFSEPQYRSPSSRRTCNGQACGVHSKRRMSRNVQRDRHTYQRIPDSTVKSRRQFLEGLRLRAGGSTPSLLKC